MKLNWNIKIGSKAGTLNKINGYYHVGINQKIYRLHRIIYLYHYGYLPKIVDHIDRNPLNNKIENLRKITYQQNNINRKSNKNSSSQYKGVSWNKKNQKWIAKITINSEPKYLGSFKSETDAAIVYNNAAIKLFGKYANLNIIKEE